MQHTQNRKKKTYRQDIPSVQLAVNSEYATSYSDSKYLPGGIHILTP